MKQFLLLQCNYQLNIPFYLSLAGLNPLGSVRHFILNLPIGKILAQGGSFDQ